MAEFDPNPPTFPGISYTAGTMNIGEGYAKGITAAGESIAKGVGSVMDTMNQNRKVDDTLLAMNQSGILGDKAYQAVAGKSLGAKQTMLGMYASEWIAQQAQNRELQKLGYAGNVEFQKTHNEFMDKIAAIQGGYGPGGQIAAGVTPQKLIINPVGGVPQTGGQPVVPTAPAVRRAQPVTQQPVTQQPPMQTQGSPTPVWAQTGNVNAPPPTPNLKTVGPPLDLSQPIPPGASMQQIRLKDGTLKDGVLLPDGTFRPRPLG